MIAWLKYAIPAIAGAFAVWLYHSAVISDMRADAATERAMHAEALQFATVSAQKEVAKIDQYYTDKRRTDLAAVPEPKRVYVRANCPSLSAADLPGVDTGTRAELDANSRRLVRELRLGIISVEAKLAACQALLRPAPSP
jgi:hypothetical protein